MIWKRMRSIAGVDLRLGLRCFIVAAPGIMNWRVDLVEPPADPGSRSGPNGPSPSDPSGPIDAEIFRLPLQDRTPLARFTSNIIDNPGDAPPTRRIAPLAPGSFDVTLVAKHPH